ncbi:MAG TPA: GAF domain-containing sensor histidine kinase [Kofleriaceae bacterium]|nr:GAF domain-containing sensor histidine kinase [Kofleriaceae bacterium]
MDRVAFETARLELARLRIPPDGGPTAALDHALKLCARTLKCDRVGYWELSRDGGGLVCRRVHGRAHDVVGAGTALSGSRYPTYWAALHEKRVIAASDARTDPVTRELTDGYLRPLGISSMLDAPVFRAGDMVGVVCFEHVGRAREWTADEINFASSAADLVSMMLEQADRLEAQEQLRLHIGDVVASEKLQVLEGLSRAVAHDFANLIAAVELVAQRLRVPDRDPGEDGELAGSLDSVAQVVGDMLGQLRRFGARTAGPPAALPVRQVVERIVPILSTLTRNIADVEVELDVDPTDVPAVTADKLEQIFLNLTLNARDAIEVHGRIVLRAHRDHDGLAIEVQDDGIGMPPGVRERIWEPYFTTKEKGTGLGLATVRAIVEDAGGHIDVDSEVGVGTTFRIWLPRAAPPPARA